MPSRFALSRVSMGQSQILASFSIVRYPTPSQQEFEDVDLSGSVASKT